ncbi:MAG: hypothetical protein QM487_14920 [Candidatus Marithrix sp.]
MSTKLSTIIATLGIGIITMPVFAELTNCDYIYGVHDRGLNDSMIFKYHPSTGFIKLGETHLGADIEGLDISPDGVMYGSAGDDTSNPGAIYTIDMNTGAKTMVGEPNGLEIDGISFNPLTGALIGWAEGEGLLSINPITGNAVVSSPANAEIEDLSWSNDGNSVYFIENNHGNNDPDASNDNNVPQELKVYTNNEFVSVCGIQGPEIEALEVLQDGTLLIGYHDNKTQMVKILDPDTCEVTLDAGVDGTPYNDIEGLAVCPPPLVIIEEG